METSIFIAQLYGTICIVVGISILRNQSHFKKMMKDMMNNSTILYFGGVMALTVGFLIIKFHNVWESNWTVLITIIGWMALIKGAVLLIAPHSMNNYVQYMQQRIQFAGYFALGMGLVLAYFGFMA